MIAELPLNTSFKLYNTAPDGFLEQKKREGSDAITFFYVPLTN